MSDPTSLPFTLIAWAVAGSLAAGVGGVLFGLAALRRKRELEGRLQTLEGALEEFCSALRLRLDLERSHRLAPEASALEADTHEAA